MKSGNGSEIGTIEAGVNKYLVHIVVIRNMNEMTVILIYRTDVLQYVEILVIEKAVNHMIGVILQN